MVSQKAHRSKGDCTAYCRFKGKSAVSHAGWGLLVLLEVPAHRDPDLSVRCVRQGPDAQNTGLGFRLRGLAALFRLLS